MSKQRLGDVLIQRGSLSEEDLNRAVAAQQEKLMRLGEILLKDGLVSKEEIGKALEQVQGVSYIKCPPERISPVALATVPQSIAVRNCALPLEVLGKKLVVAMAEPQNIGCLDELRFSAGMEISPRFSFKDDILASIEKFYTRNEDIAPPTETQVIEDGDEPQMEFITTSASEESREALRELRAGLHQRTPAVRFVSSMLAAAADRGASDIHIEPRVGDTLVRIRVDGILRELMSITPEHQAAVVSRVKILADMDIAERRVPQDGRFLMQYRERRLDLRVSSLPTHFGEKVVMRILDPKSTLATLDQLGLSDKYVDEINRILALPQGMLLVTGPTGSGKSTTLYAALKIVRSPKRNIITVEDPVEYMMDGINQVQVHPRAGLTFASCIPSILRQDPDVIMVGEIRDSETAEIALKASQTGHLVLSTLHTNDSISAITRLLDLKVPAYMIASSVTAVVAQRLARRLCGCKIMVEPTNAYRRRLLAIGADLGDAPVYEAIGCASCDNTGYRGRVGMYELLTIEGQIRDAIHSGAHADEIWGLARACGFRTMQEDALDKLKKGLTTLEEVLRVVPFDVVNAAQCSSCGHEVMATFLYCPYCAAALTDAGMAITGGSAFR